MNSLLIETLKAKKSAIWKLTWSTLFDINTHDLLFSYQFVPKSLQNETLIHFLYPLLDSILASAILVPFVHPKTVDVYALNILAFTSISYMIYVVLAVTFAWWRRFCGIAHILWFPFSVRHIWKFHASNETDYEFYKKAVHSPKSLSHEQLLRLIELKYSTIQIKIGDKVSALNKQLTDVSEHINILRPELKNELLVAYDIKLLDLEKKYKSDLDNIVKDGKALTYSYHGRLKEIKSLLSAYNLISASSIIIAVSFKDIKNKLEDELNFLNDDLDWYLES